MAERFARFGCKLVLWDVNSESNEETAAELREQNVEVYTYTCDVANSDSVYSLANKVLCLFSVALCTVFTGRQHSVLCRALY